MIKNIKHSLTAKICVLITLLLLCISGITYAMVAHFLPTYYSSQLEKNLDLLSQSMVETINSYDSIAAATNALALFEAGSQVSVNVLDEEGNLVWPEASETDEPGVLNRIYIGTGDVVYNISELESEIIEEEITISEDAHSIVVQIVDNSSEEEDSVGMDSFLWTEADIQISTNFAVKHYELEVGGVPYMMIVSGGMQPVNQAMEILESILPYILGISLVVAVIFALAASLYLTAPIVHLSRISEKMASLDFAGRYQGKRKAEIGILGKNLNVSRTLNELQAANEKLKSDIELEREQERKRIAFFSAVAHELKTPITILKGHLSGMLQGVGAYQDRDYYLQRSAETADKMESLVRELLTVSRIESGSFAVQKIDLAELLRQQISDFAELIEEKNRELDVQVPEHLYAEVNESMMEKVFANLILNAGRYTPDGVQSLKMDEAEKEAPVGAGSEMTAEDGLSAGARSELSVEDRLPVGIGGELSVEAGLPARARSELSVEDGLPAGARDKLSEAGERPCKRKNTIRIKMELQMEKEKTSVSIENTGTFIPEESLPHLFEAFYRVDPSRSRQTGGTGLGLYIVKMILEQHGAEYSITNTQEGVCAAFSL